MPKKTPPVTSTKKQQTKAETAKQGAAKSQTKASSKLASKKKPVRAETITQKKPASTESPALSPRQQKSKSTKSIASGTTTTAASTALITAGKGATSTSAGASGDARANQTREPASKKKKLDKNASTKSSGKVPPPRSTELVKKKKKKTEVVRLVTPEIADQIMTVLCQKYPEADCELTFQNDFQLLTSVILSAQTTDANVNKVTPKLFAKYPTPQALANADIDDIKQIIRSTGYFNAKAKSIQECARAIVSKFKGKIPATLEELTTLPGVGRKTANVVLGVLHKIPSWTVDTHVQRLSRRLGFTVEEDPYKIELALQKLFPEKDWSQYSITIIWHGRRTCYAKNPDCPNCPVRHLCPSSSV